MKFKVKVKVTSLDPECRGCEDEQECESKIKKGECWRGQEIEIADEDLKSILKYAMATILDSE